MRVCAHYSLDVMGTTDTSQSLGNRQASRFPFCYLFKGSCTLKKGNSMPKGSQLPSIMSNRFAGIQGQAIERSTFDRTHGIKTTMMAGYLPPIYVDEILPGDTVNLRATLMGRLATPIFPVMDNVFLDTFWFFVPMRLVWEHTEQFFGAQDEADTPVEYEIPTIGDEIAWTFGVHSIGDYFNLPVGKDLVSQAINALPFRAYNLIWNQWFRDQDLQDPIEVLKDDGPDVYSTTDFPVHQRGKRHDYFTTCRPWPQKGEAIRIPLGTTAPVIGDGQTIGLRNGTSNFGIYGDTAGGYIRATNTSFGGNIGDASGTGLPATGVLMGLTDDPDSSGMYADLSLATAATINQLREAFAFQQILELDARGGTRYTEMLLVHFGVHNGDARLMRAEYLGGSSERFQVNGVPQTSSTDSTTPQGNLAAYGEIATRAGFMKTFTEHGYIIGIANVRADINYQEQINRMWSRRTRFEFYHPALAHLGEQAVLEKELSYFPATAERVFGYQERWAEMKYKPSAITGMFRSDFAQSMDAWHLAIDFATAPQLNAAFIVDEPPFPRIMAVEDLAAEVPAPHCILDGYIKVKHSRPIPIYSTPGLRRL